MLGYDTPLAALDEGLGALGVSAAWLGDADGSVNYGDENGRAAGRVVGHVLAWRAAFRRRPRRLQLLLAVEIQLDDAVVRGALPSEVATTSAFSKRRRFGIALMSGMWTSSKCRSNAAGSSGWPYRTVILIMLIGKPIRMDERSGDGDSPSAGPWRAR